MIRLLFVIIFPINIIACDKCFEEIRKIYDSLIKIQINESELSFLDYYLFTEREKQVFELGMKMGISNALNHSYEIMHENHNVE